MTKTRTRAAGSAKTDQANVPQDAEQDTNGRITANGLYAFYTETNPRTNKPRWQHMDRKRMTKIMLSIVSTPDSVHDSTRAKAAEWVQMYGQF